MPKGGFVMKYTDFKKLFALLLCLCLVSCSAASENAYASDLVYSAVSECKALAGSYTVYMANAKEGEKGFLSEDAFYSLYHTESEPANELSMLCDWCVALCASKEARELHILKVKNKSDREAIAEMLGRRAKKLCRPELYRSESEFLYDRPKSAEVFISGSFVILCAADDISQIKEYFK